MTPLTTGPIVLDDDDDDDGLDDLSAEQPFDDAGVTAARRPAPCRCDRPLTAGDDGARRCLTCGRAA